MRIFLLICVFALPAALALPAFNATITNEGAEYCLHEGGDDGKHCSEACSDAQFKAKGYNTKARVTMPSHAPPATLTALPGATPGEVQHSLQHGGQRAQRHPVS